ncbi:MAG: acyl carrier protein [Chloroflexota bacterium]
MHKVALEQTLDISEIHDDDALVETLGLRSLDLARLVAILELKLSVDPFAELVSITSIRTVGDLYGAYSQCFAGDSAVGDNAVGDNAVGNNGASETQPTDAPRTPVEREVRRPARQRNLRRQARGNAS